MEELILEDRQKVTRIVNRKHYPYLVEFNTPEHLREQLTYLELEQLHGSLLMSGFYCDPILGDHITYKGFEWRIIARKFHVTRFVDSGKLQVPTLVVEFIGKAEDDNKTVFHEVDPLSKKEYILSLIQNPGDRLTVRQLYRDPRARALGINSPDLAAECLRAIAESDGDISYQETINRFGSVSRFIVRSVPAK
ncbi:hypothetical protein K9N68_33770 [Kovacikia minuta CCNUW1]|uniref:hypothetical protein n=1 Tax=Kovacikia minuta TaxID=2931930 RepID=UPI001CCBD197|nr:hypothetical protein [Kovacikia minuta]UBF26412.1 hypothetical protein K9N68_33770 [Kovacikia minuta CCNUW1]